MKCQSFIIQTFGFVTSLFYLNKLLTCHIFLKKKIILITWNWEDEKRVCSWDLWKLLEVSVSVVEKQQLDASTGFQQWTLDIVCCTINTCMLFNQHAVEQNFQPSIESNFIKILNFAEHQFLMRLSREVSPFQFHSKIQFFFFSISWQKKKVENRFFYSASVNYRKTCLFNLILDF